jgi:pimeloyl-ACP methyl ester carboxylesterase
MFSLAGALGILLLIGLAYEQRARRKERGARRSGRFVEIAGTRTYVVEAGEAEPTVVFLHGAGDSSSSWIAIRREAARFARSLAFDRPGLGSSESRPQGAPARPVDELEELLEKLDRRGPLVLVGHSLGGVIARLFAQRHPCRVVGLVLVDPSHEKLAGDSKFRAGMAAVGLMLSVLRLLSPVGAVRLLGSALGTMPMYPERSHFLKQLTEDERCEWMAAVCSNFRGAGGAQEFASIFPLLNEAAARFASPSDPVETPLVVLTNPGFGESWLAMHRELVETSKRGVHRVSDLRGHNIQMVRPDLVLGAIREVVEGARGRATAAHPGE